MSQALFCPTCGKNVPADAPGEVCPACLMRLGFDGQDTHDARTLPARARTAEPETVGPASQSSIRENIGPMEGAIHIPGYEVLAELGRGGMGVVYKARHLDLKRLVALKMIVGAEYASGDQIERFQREAEAVARLQHPNIVQIYEVGQREGRPYFSLEFVDGGSLADKLQGTPLPPAEAAHVVETLARAVHAAHQRGIVHRDLKPGNVLLTADGTPKIADFGLAKKTDGSSSRTQEGTVVGTPSYMAPEQAGGETKAVGPAADTYALGAILYETLTGRPPFKGITSMDTILQVISLEPAAPSDLQPQVPRDLETICLKCLHKDPARRYGSALELAEDLHRFLGHEPIQARPTSALERLGKWSIRHPAATGLTAALVLVFVAAFALVTWKWQEADRAAVLDREAKERSETQADLDRKAKDAADKLRLRAEQGEADAKNQQVIAEGQRKIADSERQLKTLELERANHALSTAQVWRAAGIWDRQPELGLELLLDGTICPPEMRDFTWRLYHRLCQCEGPKLQGHKGIVSCLAISRDGKWLASGSYDGTIKLWQLPGAKLQATLAGHKDQVWCVAFSPDGKTLASGCSDGTATLWDIRDVKGAKVFKTLTGHVGPVWCLAWTPDGKWLACGGGAFNPRDRGDGRWGRGQVVLWDAGPLAPEGARRVLYQEGKSAIISLAMAPDGKTLAAGTTFEGRVVLFDLQTDKNLGLFNPGNSWIQGLAFVGNSRLAVGGSDNTVTLSERTDDKNPTSYTVRRRLRGHLNEVWCIGASADGRSLVSTSWDNTLRLWDVATGQERLSVHNVHAVNYDGPTLAAVLSPDGKLLAAAQQDTIRLWTVPATPYQTTQKRHNHGVLSVAVSPDGGSFASASQDFTVKLWSYPSRAELATCQGHKERVTSVAYAPDGKTVGSGSWDNTVKIWRADDGKEVKTLTGHKAEVMAVAYSAAGQLFSASIDGTVLQWDEDAAAPVRTFGPHAGGVATLALSRDGKILAVADNFHVRFVKYGRGKYLAGGEKPGTVTLWNVADGRKLHTLTGHRQAVVSLAFRDDGLLATASWDGTVKLWNSAVGAEVASLPKQNKLHALAFSHDGKTLALGTDDRAVQLWDVGSAPRWLFQRAVLKGHDRETTCLAFGKDDQYLVSGSGSPYSSWWVSAGEVLLWDASR